MSSVSIASPRGEEPDGDGGAAPVASDAPGSTVERAGLPNWTRDVEPILAKHDCARCHGRASRKSGLDVRTAASLLAGGEGGPAIVPGDPEASPLYRVLLPDADPAMPPRGERLSAGEVAVVRSWILHASLDRESGSLSGESERAVGSEAEGGGGGDDQQATPQAWVRRLPSGLTPRRVIDLAIEWHWLELGVSPAQECDDRAWARRVYLDLLGRIPTPAELDAFASDLSTGTSDKSTKRREMLVEALLDSPEHARHLREVFDVVLLGRSRPRTLAARREHGWNDWLERAFAENRPWDVVVREMIEARPREPREAGSVRFLFERKDDHKAVAEALAPAVLGVRVECAQCHDHPLAPEIEQRHYWGLVSFFARSRNVDTKAGPGVAESASGGFAKFADLEGESHPAVPVLFDIGAFDEPWPEDDAMPEESPADYVVPPAKEGEAPARAAVPARSRRARLAQLVAEEGDLIARAFVNRAWALLVGRGFVHPVDRMDSAHPPSHPGLLAWLADDFRASGFDVRRLVREIVTSRTYAADSRWTGDGSPPRPETFARGIERPLTAEVLARSLRVALTGEAAPAPDAMSVSEEDLLRVVRDRFPVVFPEEPGATLEQALFLTNSQLLTDLLAPGETGTLRRMLDAPSHEARTRIAFAAFFGREPDAEELEASAAYLESRADRPLDGVQQLVWALLSSAEFRSNH